MEMKVEIGSASYKRWRNEVILDFGDYAFTRNELDAIGMGLHAKAARNLQRVSHKHKYDLAAFRRLGAPSIFRIHGVGEVSMIVLAYCLTFTFEDFDVHKWMDMKIRTIKGGVRAMKKSA